MESEDRAEVLRVLSDVQTDTASISVEIGGTKPNGQVDHEALVIKNAPGRVIKTLSGMGYRLSVVDGGVHVSV